MDAGTVIGCHFSFEDASRRAGPSDFTMIQEINDAISFAPL
jgi:hypothetical protein